jgi:RNA polymerase sigma factor (sigma-70 family)
LAFCPPHIVRWVSLHVIPQEQKVRAALRRQGVTDSDIDDLIQDAYCRLATLQSVDHIDRPGAYFMQIVKNAWRDSLRRARVVRLENFTENGAMFVEDVAAGVEATVIAREQLGLIEALLEALPERCRTIFTWKRMEGISQREIARRLGVSENVVENDVQKALRAIQRALRGNPNEDRPKEDREEWKIDDRRRKIG